MTPKSKLLYLEPREELDQFILGIGRWSGSPRQVFAYDYDAMIEHWAEEMLLLFSDPEEAYIGAKEYFEYNISMLAIPTEVGWQPVYVSKAYLEDLEEEAHESIIGVGFSFGEESFLVYDADCTSESDPEALYVSKNSLISFQESL
tara:strand:- start:380 stop:817 length:438 start_codon:yes stop_codon:yes gene_type:complete